MMDAIRSPETAVTAITWINRAFFIPVLITKIRPYKLIRANLRRQSDVVHASSSKKSACSGHSKMSANVPNVVGITCLESPLDLV